MEAGKGPNNGDERFLVSADFKCFRKGVWGWGGGPLMMMKESLLSTDFKFFRKGVWGREGAQ